MQRSSSLKSATSEPVIIQNDDLTLLPQLVQQCSLAFQLVEKRNFPLSTNTTNIMGSIHPGSETSLKRHPLLEFVHTLLYLQLCFLKNTVYNFSPLLIQQAEENNNPSTILNHLVGQLVLLCRQFLLTSNLLQSSDLEGWVPLMESVRELVSQFRNVIGALEYQSAFILKTIPAMKTRQWIWDMHGVLMQWKRAWAHTSDTLPKDTFSNIS